MPNKVNTIDHKSKAKGQWIRRWSTNSPFLLHIQHQFKIKIFRFQKLSIVRIFPKLQSKQKSNFGRDLRLPRERLINTFFLELDNKNELQNLFP